MSTQTATRPTTADSGTDKPPVAHIAHRACDERFPGGFCGQSHGQWIPAGTVVINCAICAEIDKKNPDVCPLCGEPFKRITP